MAEQSHTWHCVDLAQRLNGVLGSSCSSLTASDGVLTPVEDLAELRATLEFVQSTLQPEVAAGADAVAASDPAAAICIEGVRNTLDELTLFVQDYVLARRRTPLTVTMWRDQRIYLYQLDFLLKQKIDQFAALFLQGRDAAQLIEDYDGQQLWINAFGSRVSAHRRALLAAAAVLRAQRSASVLGDFLAAGAAACASLGEPTTHKQRSCAPHRSQWCRGTCFVS